MKKNVLIFGSILGAILVGNLIYSTQLCYNHPETDTNDVIGYAAMIVVFSLVFVGMKNYRDKYNGGVITFGKAFKNGAFITLLAGTLYVLAWLVEYYTFMPDFIDKYTVHVMIEAERNGATATEMTEKAADMAKFKEMYKNPLFVIAATYIEVVPAGLLVALISALILKRKTVRNTGTQNN